MASKNPTNPPRKALAGAPGSPSAASPLAFPPPVHDHEACVRQALARAAALCRERNLQFTPLRREVLALVWNSHAPIGAYDILDALSRRKDRLSGRAAARSRVAPPTVYRVLDFLCRERLIHRVESQNAYVGCGTPGTPHGTGFLLCRDCGAALELQDDHLTAAVARSAARHNFKITQETIEITGLCKNCQGSHEAKVES